MRAVGRVRYGVDASQALIQRILGGSERRLRSGRHSSTPDHEAVVHRLLGLEWPCPARGEFDELWLNVIESLRAQGLDLGRGAYGGWDDADPAVARAVWCLVCHRRPEVVVETGVARGLTTRIILEALQRNGTGRLWSVDMAPSRVLKPGLADQTGAAVPPMLRDRWTLLLGTSRHYLPGLVDGLAQIDLPIDLFVHDSLHTGRNVRFELNRIWPALAADGAVLVDDVEQNAAFGAFICEHPGERALVCDASDGRSQFGVLLR